MSESWAALAAARALLRELGVPLRRVVFVDLCSGKALTAVLLALTFPESEVLALDIISGKCLPHTEDVPNLRYVEANLFRSEPMLRAVLERPCDGEAAAGGSCARQRVGVLVGSHLCGRLSAQAVDLFHGIEAVAALVLSPCCWPRTRDYSSDQDLEQMARLMMQKAQSVDTYSTWARYLLAMAADRMPPPRNLQPSADVLAALKAAGGGGELWSACGRFMAGPADTTPWLSKGDAGPSVTTASSLDTPRNLGWDEAEAQDTPAPAVERRNAASVQISTGLYHDRDILSEKDYVLVAAKIPSSQAWASAGRRRSTEGVHKRYVAGVAGGSVGPSESYGALCEVWGMPRPPAPSTHRPLPPLQGSTKPFRGMAKKARHHRASRILIDVRSSLPVPGSARRLHLTLTAACLDVWRAVLQAAWAPRHSSAEPKGRQTDG